MSKFLDETGLKTVLNHTTSYIMNKTESLVSNSIINYTDITVSHIGSSSINMKTNQWKTIDASNNNVIDSLITTSTINPSVTLINKGTISDLQLYKIDDNLALIVNHTYNKNTFTYIAYDMFTINNVTEGQFVRFGNEYCIYLGKGLFKKINLNTLYSYINTIYNETNNLYTSYSYVSSYYMPITDTITYSNYSTIATTATNAQYASNIKWHTCNYGPANWGSASFIDVEIGKDWLGLDNYVTNDYHLFICTITDDDNGIGVHCIFNKYTNYSWRLINYSPLLEYDYNTITTSISEANEYEYTIDGYDGECNITIKGYFI